MSATCGACQAPAELFLCQLCQGELRDMLRSLAEGPRIATVAGRTASGGQWFIERRTPGLLANLADVVLRRTRIGGGGGGHRKRGDEIASPFEPDTDKGRRTRQGEASVLLDAVTAGLSATVRDLTESRGSVCPRADAEGAAAFLAAHVAAIACDEGAGQTHAEVHAYVRRIERIIDRPTRRVWLGECPTWNEHTRLACATRLWAPEDAIEVYCRTCHRTHNCKRIQLLTENDLEREKVPWDRILQANKSQPHDRQVPERTLQSWRRPGRNGEPARLRARGYRRPDGREVITSHSEDDTPLYLWSDIRRLRAEKPQKSATGAAAHRRVAG